MGLADLFATMPVAKQIDRDAREKGARMVDVRKGGADDPQPCVLHDVICIGRLEAECAAEEGT